jgi:hypothetical protein
MHVKTAMLRCLFAWALILTPVVIPMAGEAAAPDFLWLRTAGAEGIELGYSIAVDPAGSSFIAGEFSSTNLEFGSIVLTNAQPPFFDAFVARYNSDGTLLWAKRMGGTNDDRALAIAIDAQDNCYVAGNYVSSNFFTGGVTLTNYAPNGNGSIFVAKFDATGNLLWARGPDWAYDQFAGRIAVDAAGNCYVTGQFNGTNIYAGRKYVSRGYSDVLLLKYDPNGNLLWVQTAGGNYVDGGSSVTVDAAGNAYLLAYTRSTNAVFGNAAAGMTYTFAVQGQYTDQDIIVAKYAPSGYVVWARQFGGGGLDGGTGIVLDNGGNIYITGSYTSTNILFGATTLTNIGDLLINSLFLAKLDSTGNPLWAKAVHGDNQKTSAGVAVDFAGNSYIAGYFQSSNLFFDTITLTNTESGGYIDDDIFIAKYDTMGNLLWVDQPRGTNFQFAYSIAVDAMANAYVSGSTQGTNVLFGSLATTNTYLDLFVAKLDSDYTFLQCGLSNGTPVISWPAAHRDGFVPEVTTNFQSWSPAKGLIFTNNGTKYLTNSVTGDRQFFRLRQVK